MSLTVYFLFPSLGLSFHFHSSRLVMTFTFSNTPQLSHLVFPLRSFSPWTHQSVTPSTSSSFYQSLHCPVLPLSPLLSSPLLSCPLLSSPLLSSPLLSCLSPRGTPPSAGALWVPSHPNAYTGTCPSDWGAETHLFLGKWTHPGTSASLQRL